MAIWAEGTPLGHALYELALIDQNDRDQTAAIQKLTRLVDEVPKYPGMEKVLYELGWSQREAGKSKDAAASFARLLKQYPQSELAGEAAYFLGQELYAASNWQAAAEKFQLATASGDAGLSEKAYYRLGWSYFKSQRYSEAAAAFASQAQRHADGPLALDAMMMVGECAFKSADYQKALDAFSKARAQLQANDDRADTIRSANDRQVRELVLLHGGQSAAQLKRWDDAIGWYDELRSRFPATTYLAQVFYETGVAYQQQNQNEQALKLFEQVATQYRNETAARARFMMGEIRFGDRQYDKAITEFQRVMFGFGAEQAPDSIKNWQAKSGFEAGRCGEALSQQARTRAKQSQAISIAIKFYQYVVEKHPNNELVAQSNTRVAALQNQSN
ncbi:MAG: tetratricopeptide repeat protein [Planctomycetota bacterium]